MRHLRPDRGRDAIAHGAKAARCHPAVGVFESQKLRRPHLVLADLGADISVHILGQRLKPLQGVLRFDDFARLFEGQTIHLAPIADLALPFGDRCLIGFAPAGFPHLQDILEHMGDIADDGDIGLDHLVDRRRVDIDMGLDGFGAEGIDHAGDAVIKARADVDHQVAIMHGHVCLV